MVTAGVIVVAQQPASNASPAVTSANLIQNGSFESPSIWQTTSLVEYDTGSTTMPGWTVGGDSVDLTGENYWDAEDGDQSLDLSGAAPGSVSQSVATTAGTVYTLTWWMAGNPNCGQPIKTMDVSWDGTVVDAPTFNDTGDSNTSMGWVQLQLNVQATGSSSVLEFADATTDQSQCGATLDNVSLVPATIGQPVFTEDSPALSALQGSVYSAIFFASGVPTYSLVGAPSWLSVNQYGAVTGTVPTGISSFSYSVSASNADGNATAGPYTVNVQQAASISGTVVDGGLAANPVSGAAVQACVTGSSECEQATTAADGTFTVPAPVGASVSVTAFPLPGSGDATTSTAPATVPAAGISGLTISLDGVEPISGGLEINGSDAPTVYWANPSTATVTGCPDGLASVTVIGNNTSTGQFTSNVIMLTETPEGSGNYTGTIPPQEPVHGPVQVQSSVICPPQSALSPNEGSAAGGTTVILTGSGFTGATGVSFGSVPATSFSVLSDDDIQAVAPAGTGTVSVSVTVGGSTAVVDQYTYQAVQSISPSTGPAAGGTWVVINGTGLDSATAVDFGTTGAEFYQLSSTEIEALSPPGTGTQDITITTAFGGTTPTTTADEFTYGASTTAAVTRSHGPAAAVLVSRPLVHSAPAAGSRAAGPVTSAVLTAATGSLVLKFYNFIYQHGPDLVNGKSDLKNIVANLLPAEPTCSEVQEAVEGQIELEVAPAIDALANYTLPLIEDAEFEAGLASGPEGLALAFILYSVTPFAWNALLDWTASVYIKAAVQALYGSCPPEDPPPPPPPLGPPPPPPGNTPPTHSFNPNTYIDPSGTVLDTNGNPVSGATVTILRAGTSAGPFTQVSTSGPGIRPATNPETTGSDGVFHWDVFSGWYEIQATAPGCADPTDSAQSAVTIGPYPVPPPQVGLTITMACSNQAPPPTPVVSSLSQSSGPAAGGTTLTVLGSGFTPDSTVKFGGTAAQSVTYLSSQALTVTSPAGSGLVDLTVQNGGTSSATSSADQFFYGSVPTVTGVSPSSGPAAGGTAVTITGTGFTGATAVAFGGAPATSFTVVSGTQIQATAPAAARTGTVDVTVVTPAGPSASVTADQYTYQANPPAIDGQVTAKGTSSVSARITTATSGDLILAFVAAEGPNFTAQTAKVSGGGLTWTLAKRTNTKNGTAEIWEARASGVLSQASITSALGFTGSYAQSLTVVAFKNAPGIGALAGASGSTGTPTASLTTTYPNSWVFAVGNATVVGGLSPLGSAQTEVTAGAGQTLVSTITDSDGDTGWVQSRSVPTPAAGTAVTINDTAPVNDLWNLTLIEIT